MPGENTHFEAPCFFFEVLVPLHLLGDLLEVLFHLLAQTLVETTKIGEAGYAEVEMQHMVLGVGENFSKKSSLQVMALV